MNAADLLDHRVADDRRQTAGRLNALADSSIVKYSPASLTASFKPSVYMVNDSPGAK